MEYMSSDFYDTNLIASVTIIPLIYQARTVFRGLCCVF